MYKEGKYDIKILKKISKSKDGYFNISAFSRENKISKGTIKPALNRLIKYNLICNPERYKYKILNKGRYIIRSKSYKIGGRGVVRTKKIKSIHSVEVIIETNIKNIGILIEKLSPLRYFKSYPKNWTQHNLEFEDGSRIIIKPHTTTLHITECHGKTWEECDNNVKDEVFVWIKKLESLGVGTYNVHVNYSHFANINSTFANAIKERLGKYELKKENGVTYWIDYSTGDIEGETDDVKTREGVDLLINEAAEGRKLSDIDPIKNRLLIIERILEKLTISHKKTTESLESQTKILELKTQMENLEINKVDKWQTELRKYTG